MAHTHTHTWTMTKVFLDDSTVGGCTHKLALDELGPLLFEHLVLNDLARIELVQAALVLLCRLFLEAKSAVVLHLCVQRGGALRLQPGQLLVLAPLLCPLLVDVRRLDLLMQLPQRRVALTDLLDLAHASLLCRLSLRQRLCQRLFLSRLPFPTLQLHLALARTQTTTTQRSHM